MSSNRKEPSEEDIARMKLPAIRSSGGSGVGQFHRAHPEAPRGRAGRKLEAETSLAIYRIEREIEKTQRIQRGAAQVTVHGFSMLDRASFAMLADLARRERPEEIDLYLKQILVNLIGNLGDDLEASREAYFQRVLRELR